MGNARITFLKDEGYLYLDVEATIDRDKWMVRVNPIYTLTDNYIETTQEYSDEGGFYEHIYFDNGPIALYLT